MVILGRQVVVMITHMLRHSQKNRHPLPTPPLIRGGVGRGLLRILSNREEYLLPIHDWLQYGISRNFDSMFSICCPQVGTNGTP